MDLSTSSNGIKVSFVEMYFQSLFSLKRVCCSCLLCVFWMKLWNHARFAEFSGRNLCRAVWFGSVSSNNSESGKSALLSVTNTQNRQSVVKTFRKIFSLFRSALNLCRIVFFLAGVFLKTLKLKASFARNFLRYCKKQINFISSWSTILCTTLLCFSWQWNNSPAARLPPRRLVSLQNYR